MPTAPRILATGSILLLSCFASAPARSVEPLTGPTDMVIVTIEELAPAFRDYAEGRSGTGVRTQVVTLAEIEQTSPAGRDLPERIRSWLIAAHDDHQLRYLLLGGDPAVVPTRYARSSFYPVSGHTDLPTDLYYGCLDGDWDADGDGIFGEAYQDFLNTGDDVDLVAELIVGRVPISTLSKAASWSVKALSPYRGYFGTEAVWAAEVLFPWDWSHGEPIIIDGAALVEDWFFDIMAIDPEMQQRHFFQNRADYWYAQPLSGPAVADALQASSGALFTYVGVGDSTSLRCGGTPLTATELAGLSNAPHYFVANLMSTASAAFDRTSVGATLVTDSDGGAITAMGFTRDVFPTTASNLFDAYFEALLATPSKSIAGALEQVRSQYSTNANVEGAIRWLLLSWAFLGDPSTGLPVEAVLSDATSTPPNLTPVTLHPIVPNPFNPRTIVAFTQRTAGRVRLEVHDLRGRHLRTLVDERREAGRHELVFDGRDDGGHALSSGVYLVSIEAKGHSSSRKLTLVR